MKFFKLCSGVVGGLMLISLTGCNLPLTSTQIGTAIQAAISKDPVLRWKCPTPAPVYWFYTNNEGKAELPLAQQRQCVAIDPVTVKP